MLNLYTPTQIEQLKRDAKRTARDRSITHAVALDQIAATCGYSNWSLLAKHISSRQMGATPPQAKCLSHIFLRTADAMRQAMRKTTIPHGSGSSQDHLRAQIEDLSLKFISADNALDFAISYMECALGVARFSINGQSLAYYEMRCWLPYCVHVVKENSYILLGRDYKPIGMVQKKKHINYADFPQVHLHLTEPQLRQKVTVHSKYDGAEGYLYDNSPSTSRSHAQSYLNHLREFRKWLSSREV